MTLMACLIVFIVILAVEAHAWYWIAHHLGGGWYQRSFVPPRLATLGCIVALMLSSTYTLGLLLSCAALVLLIALAVLRQRLTRLLDCPVHQTGKASKPLAYNPRERYGTVLRQAVEYEPKLLAIEYGLSLLMMLSSLGALIFVGLAN